MARLVSHFQDVGNTGTRPPAACIFSRRTVPTSHPDFHSMSTATDQSPRAGTGLLPKCPTGIQGLDEITDGVLPKGPPTLVCGGAGCGMTLLAAEVLVQGAIAHREPGVLMSFEDRAEN